MRNTEQFLSLLLFQRTHLILEHFALEETLSLVFKALEFDTLRDDGRTHEMIAEARTTETRNAQQICPTY
jgi:hypothetical protein